MIMDGSLPKITILRETPALEANSLRHALGHLSKYDRIFVSHNISTENNQISTIFLDKGDVNIDYISLLDFVEIVEHSIETLGRHRSIFIMYDSRVDISGMILVIEHLGFINAGPTGKLGSAEVVICLKEDL